MNVMKENANMNKLQTNASNGILPHAGKRNPGPAGVMKNDRSKQESQSLAGIRPIQQGAIRDIIANNIPQARLNPNNSTAQNCPATASAMDEWLGTGRINPAEGGDALTTYTIQNVAWSRRMNLSQLMTFIQSSSFPPDRFITVQGTRSLSVQQSGNLTPNHYFVLAKVESDHHNIQYWYLDAFGTGYSRGPGRTDVMIALQVLHCSYFQHALSQFRVTAANVPDFSNPMPPGLD